MAGITSMPASPALAITATLLLAGTLLTSGCGRDHDGTAATTTPTVTVTPVISRAVSDSQQFIASTSAIRSVTLRARVNRGAATTLVHRGRDGRQG